MTEGFEQKERSKYLASKSHSKTCSAWITRSVIWGKEAVFVGTIVGTFREQKKIYEFKSLVTLLW